ncbi:ParB/RepB/Spo0J family partition protein [bacterium]|nr:ParB/RepB/Spo0J family partition protein [bacterium]
MAKDRKKRGLGRGLDAILPGDVEELLEYGEKSGQLEEIPIEQVKPNPFQPRREFDPKALEELAESIKSQGVLQPILVARDGEDYVLIAGERRIRASKLAGLEKIPAIVLPEKPSDEQLVFLALVENLQREDLDPVEEAEAYRTLAEKFGMTQEEIARRVGKSRPAVANALRLLRLPPKVLELLRERKITTGHAIVLLEEPDPQRQVRLAQLAARRGLSVERLGLLVHGREDKKRRARRKTKSPEILALEEELSMELGTRVTIEKGKKKGKIVIEFFTDDDLKEIISRLSE